MSNFINNNLYAEQDYINKLLQSMGKTLEENKKLLEEIEKNFPNSVILNYYTGMFLQKKNPEKAKENFKKAVDIEPLFTAPYYELANYYIEEENKSIEIEKQEILAKGTNMGKRVYSNVKKFGRPFFKKAENLLMKIFFKETIDFTVPQRTKRISIEDDLRISSILCPIYMADRMFPYVENIYSKILKHYEKLKPEEIRSKQNYMICWKNIHIDLGQIYFHKNQFDKAYDTYKNGFKYGLGLSENHDIDMISKGIQDNSKSNYLISKYLLEACMLTRHYMTYWPELPLAVNEIYDTLISKNFKNEIFSNRSVDKFEVFKSRLKEKPSTNSQPQIIETSRGTDPFNQQQKNVQYENISLVLKGTLKKSSKKIKIGYLSPDLNKNAVGLFIGAQMRKYNPDKFEIFSFYTNANSDEYTNLFRGMRTTWIECGKMSSKELCDTILSCEIDILVDLIAHGHGNTMEAIKILTLHKNKPIIINYIGYPDTTMLKGIDYRLVDKYTDPFKSPDITEELIYMKRCFLCYYPFDNEEIPKINYFREPGYIPRTDLEDINYGNDPANIVRIGILNKSSKHSPHVFEDWKYIMSKCPNSRFYIKLDQFSDVQKYLYKSLPQDRINILNFKAFLQEYYEIYNNIDLCIDVYPYSGTTTTCSALYMGIPTYSIYDPEDKTKRHVSNVSGSILINSEQQEYICKNRKEFCEKVINHINNYLKNPDTNEKRYARRQKFLECMDPIKFMEEYEELLTNLYNKRKNDTQNNDIEVIDISN